MGADFHEFMITGFMADTSNGIAKVSELLLMIRAIGKSSSPDLIRSVHLADEDFALVLESTIEKIVPSVSAVVRDLLDQCGRKDLSARFADARSFRDLGDQIDFLLDSKPSPDLFFVSFSSLSSDSFPLPSIRRLGTFLLGLSSGCAVDGPNFRTSGGSVSFSDLSMIQDSFSSWHKSRALLAVSSSVPASFSPGVDSSEVASPLFEFDPVVRHRVIGQFQVHGLDSCGDLSMAENLICSALFLFVRLLQKPFASWFFRSRVIFCVSDSGGFQWPDKVMFSLSDQPADLVSRLVFALDASLALPGDRFASTGIGPVGFFSEALFHAVGRAPQFSFHDFTIQYLRLLVRKQDSVVLPNSPDDFPVSVIQSGAQMFLDCLLDSQIDRLKRVRNDHVDDRSSLISAAVVTAGLLVAHPILDKYSK